MTVPPNPGQWERGGRSQSRRCRAVEPAGVVTRKGVADIRRHIGSEEVRYRCPMREIVGGLNPTGQTGPGGQHQVKAVAAIRFR